MKGPLVVSSVVEYSPKAVRWTVGTVSRLPHHTSCPLDLLAQFHQEPGCNYNKKQIVLSPHVRKFSMTLAVFCIAYSQARSIRGRISKVL